MSERLTGFRVAILATDLFEEAELFEPRKALVEQGAITVVIAPHAGEIQAAHHGAKTKKVKVDQTLTDADPEQFDAVLIPGGQKNVDALRKDPLALEFVRHIDQTHRPIAVICHGPWLLAAAHLVKGRHMTGYSAIQDEIRNAGAFCTDKEVVRDRNWVSSRQPSDIPHFNEAMLSLFVEHQVRSRVAA